MRYFIIFYSAINNKDGFTNGYFVMSANIYPSNKFIHQEIEKISDCIDNTITNIIEFNNHKDYSNFIGE